MNGNDELLGYLRTLADGLRSRGCDTEANDIGHAARFASGSPSEFLHEAQQALRRTSSSPSATLTEAERAKLSSVVAQIDAAFNRVGGA